MTLAITWRRPGGMYMAADTQVVSSGHGVYREEKIFSWQGCTVAFAGDTAIEHWFKSLQQETMAQDLPEYWNASIAPALYKTAKEFEADYDFLITNGTVIWTTDGPYLRKVESNFCAIGSAAAFAYGWFSQHKEEDWSPTQVLSDLFYAASDFDVNVGEACTVKVIWEKPKSRKKRGA